LPGHRAPGDPGHAELIGGHVAEFNISPGLAWLRKSSRCRFFAAGRRTAGF
jgi:hypothetical protein